MKKVLLATSALVLSAGYAAAEAHSGISLSGSANAGFKYAEGADDEITLHNEINFVITGVGASDNGLEFGAFIELDEDTGNDDEDGTDNNGVADAEAYISGVFGTITVGDVDPATDGFGIADVGFDGIGVDDDAEGLKNGVGTGADLVYSYSASGITFTASAGVDNEDYAAAIEYATDMFSVGLGYIEGNGADNETLTVVAGISQGPVSANAIYSDWTGGEQAYGVDVSFDTGAATITAVWGSTSVAGNDDDYGVGVSVPLGGGLSVAGGVGSVDGQTKADLGVTMSF